jgi:hypothetical protein
MAQPIKYNTGSKTTGCCIRKGNYDIGVVENYQYGPTASTGFWAGYPPDAPIPTGGFISYQNKASQGPSIYSIANIDELVQYGLNLNIGLTNDTPAEVIEACSNLNTIALVNIDYPELPQIDNLLLNLDAGYTASYPWMGTNWNSVAGGTVTQATLNNTPVWVSGGSAYNYSDSYFNMNSGVGQQYASCSAFGSALQEFTISAWINITTGNFNNRVCVVGQNFREGTTTNSNFAIRGNGTNGYQGYIRLANTDYTVNFGSADGGGFKHYVFTFDGTNTMTAYLDGNVVAQTGGPSGTLISNGLDTIIGGNENGGASGSDTFNGLINNVLIYNTALDNGAVTTLYNLYQNQRGF